MAIVHQWTTMKTEDKEGLLFACFFNFMFLANSDCLVQILTDRIYKLPVMCMIYFSLIWSDMLKFSYVDSTTK